MPLRYDLECLEVELQKHQQKYDAALHGMSDVSCVEFIQTVSL